MTKFGLSLTARLRLGATISDSETDSQSRFDATVLNFAFCCYKPVTYRIHLATESYRKPQDNNVLAHADSELYQRCHTQQK
jgi:hypothetical protein